MNYNKLTKKELIELVMEKVKVKFPQDTYKFLEPHCMEDQEVFIVLTLRADNSIIKSHVVTKGLINRCLVHPREVFRPAITDNANSIIVAHNHPSGSTSPSEEDNAVTKRLRDAGQILGIPVLDHLIFTKGMLDVYSYESDNKF